jgi:CDGSH-type Zn-finger protein/ferredoxin
MEEHNGIIKEKKDASLVFEKLFKLIDCEGNELETKETMFICRCGGSKNKPFCDGTHKTIGFTSSKSEDRVPNRVKEYVGKNITIVDNRGVCSHDGSCLKYAPNVFIKDARPWINPDGDSVENIIDTIKKCPSGALSYKLDGKHYTDYCDEKKVVIKKKGPLEIKGGVMLSCDSDDTPQIEDHYTLCRCGGSKNKPFCDGTHLNNGFEG